MEQALTEFVGRMFVGPVWPASLLVCLMVFYTLIAVLGLIDLDLDVPDMDAGIPSDLGVPDLDAPDLGGPDLDGVQLETGGGDFDVGEAGTLDFISGIAATTVRWTNFGRVPLVIWVGAFTVIFWAISYGLWHYLDASRYAPTWLVSILLAARNFVLATIVTKFVTQPAVGKFTPPPGYDTERLLGATCEISSIAASPSFGQAKFRTNAAPLLLNVRTKESEIPKGTEVRIIDYDSSKRIYTVIEIQPENKS
ncbi:DUF1449 domain-containing protein [Roseiconus nitratireducens]|uniref:DUF1449 domain-containing protein n=1 Tax=Roseiconus nitratireducens TaxID=2605748 RepID=A0A5M6CYI2_9BACT|nr:OB-fold-containig protein [Roseiconus nitratireducens]KAA5540261.1 DUF1449 domain-containing protein [Roseiconus nitratireducens]